MIILVLIIPMLMNPYSLWMLDVNGCRIYRKKKQLWRITGK
ncbi:unnamed protein product [Schistosoma curassoni]|uniref:G_PROTEIN_RECEP_F1_2 domain-containing protein n=1 Tax=Schistosoma curassoni TaxID=6186 RepID=A0A183KSD9_9TREM|nr:unnamed protein product [Schistosoma curassoni]